MIGMTVFLFIVAKKWLVCYNQCRGCVPRSDIKAYITVYYKGVNV